MCGITSSFHFGVSVNRLDGSYWMHEMRMSRSCVCISHTRHASSVAATIAWCRDLECGLSLPWQMGGSHQKSTWKQPVDSLMDIIPAIQSGETCNLLSKQDDLLPCLKKCIWRWWSPPMESRHWWWWWMKRDPGDLTMEGVDPCEWNLATGWRAGGAWSGGGSLQWRESTMPNLKA